MDGVQAGAPTQSTLNRTIRKHERVRLISIHFNSIRAAGAVTCGDQIWYRLSMRAAVGWFLALTILGCDREQPAPPAPAVKRVPALGVEIQRVTPLPPDRRTHIAPNGKGQVFWVQEADGGGRETVFAISEGGLPVATRFANVTVLETLAKPDAHGSIESLAVGPDGKVYFYFIGGSKRQSIAAFGNFAPETGKVQILADTAALAGDSRLGNSLALARGSIVRVGDVLWLWLRHDDAYALLSLDITRTGSALRQTFEAVRGNGQELRLTSATEDLARGPGNSLVYLQRPTARIWKIGPLGEATQLTELGDPPATLSAPVLDERGRLIFFASDTAAVTDISGLPTTNPTPEYPALIIFDPDQQQRTLLGRNTFAVPDKINLRSLAPPQLVRDRASWLAYDPPTGELLRLRMVER
jgi:hypothetical protein